MNEYGSSAIDLVPAQPLMEHAIGTFVMRLSFLHVVLEINLWSLMGINQTNGRILTEDLPLSKLTQRIYQVVKEKNPKPETLKDLKKILKELEKVNEERNRLAHGFWSFPDNGPPQIILKKGPLVSKNAPTYLDIRLWIERADKFLDDFTRCISKIYSAQPTNQ